MLHWLNTSAVCPLELNCPLKFCPSSWKKGAFSPALWWRHALSVSEVTQHAATSLFLCSKMQHKYTAALISNGSYANGRVIFPSPHLAQHAFISPNTLKCGGKKREKNPTAGFTFCGNSRGHKQAYSCNMQLNVLQQVSSKTRWKTTGWVQTIIIRNQTSEIKLCRRHSEISSCRKFLTIRTRFVSVGASAAWRKRKSRLIEGGYAAGSQSRG